jgi:nitroreductase
MVRGTAAVAFVVCRVAVWWRFDAGRIAQNMMLAAWSDGVGSCPNAIARPEELASLLGVEDGEEVAIILALGFPTGHRDPASRSPDEWLARADRAPLADVVSDA